MQRQGFVRVALDHGAKLVPVLGFGENEVFHSPLRNDEGSRLRKAQNWLQRKLGFAIPIFSGRGTII